MKIYLLGWGLCFLTIGYILGTLPPQKHTPDTSFVQHIPSISRSVVSLSITSKENEQITTTRDGTGIIITQEGTVLTNSHLINGGGNIVVTFSDETKMPAEVIKTHRSYDLALLKILTPTPQIFPVGDFIESQAHVSRGQRIIAIGNMLGLYSGSVSEGIVSGLNRTVAFNGISMNGLLQTSIPMTLGNSGGPLVNEDGKIIGINVGIVGGSSQIGWALPLTQSDVEEFLHM